jgi:hypothetical protein
MKNAKIKIRTWFLWLILPLNFIQILLEKPVTIPKFCFKVIYEE